MVVIPTLDFSANSIWVSPARRLARLRLSLSSATVSIVAILSVGFKYFTTISQIGIYRLYIRCIMRGAKRKAPESVAKPAPRPETKGGTAPMARTPIIREPDSKVPADKRLARLEERFRHELMDDEERQVLRDRVLALRRRLSR
jgi:hypothetical protein